MPLTTAQLNTEADIIKNEPVAHNNTATRLVTLFKDIIASMLNPTNGDVLPKANGGTGTSTPGLVAGTNISISGTWPNQTIDASAVGTSGIYTPTSPASSNVTSKTIYPNFLWERIGNIVHVSGQISIAPTSAGGSTTTVSLTLPVASTLGDGLIDVNGVLISGDATFQAGVVEQDVPNTAASLKFLAQTTGSSIFKITFMYKII